METTQKYFAMCSSVLNCREVLIKWGEGIDKLFKFRKWGAGVFSLLSHDFLMLWERFFPKTTKWHPRNLYLTLIKNVFYGNFFKLRRLTS